MPCEKTGTGKRAAQRTCRKSTIRLEDLKNIEAPIGTEYEDSGIIRLPRSDFIRKTCPPGQLAFRATPRFSVCRATVAGLK